MSIDLGVILSQFASLAFSGVTNISADTSITGDVGTSTAGYSGLIASQINGIFHPVDDTDTQTAQAEFDLAFTQGTALPITVSGAWDSGSGPFSGSGGYDLTGVELGGTITVLGPGVYSFDSDANLTDGTLTLDAMGDPDAVFIFQIGDDLNVSAGTAIALANGANSCNVFFLVDGTANIGTGAEFIGNLLSFGSITLGGGNIVIGRLLTNNGSISLVGAPSLITNVCICYAKGTNILTKDGYVPIENLQIGDELITFGDIPEGYKPIKRENFGKTQKVTWVGSYVACDLTPQSYPICIKRNALGINMPRTDVFVSPNHGLHVNGKFVSAKNLINGTTIYQDKTFTSIEYYHVELKNHSIIVADGLFAESYLDANKYVRKQWFVQPIHERSGVLQQSTKAC